MLAIALNIALIAFGLAILLALWRVFKGPDMTDRLLALDTLYTNAMGLALLIGVRFYMNGGADRSDFFEVALLIALMGFVGTVAGARFLSRGDAIE
ncbi:MAG: K+/H+ antiporter subunit F [Burkholderiaceae bacterium]